MVVLCQQHLQRPFAFLIKALALLFVAGLISSLTACMGGDPSSATPKQTLQPLTKQACDLISAEKVVQIMNISMKQTNNPHLPASPLTSPGVIGESSSCYFDAQPETQDTVVKQPLLTLTITLASCDGTAMRQLTNNYPQAIGSGLGDVALFLDTGSILTVKANTCLTVSTTGDQPADAGSLITQIAREAMKNL